MIMGSGFVDNCPEKEDKCPDFVRFICLFQKFFVTSDSASFAFPRNYCRIFIKIANTNSFYLLIPKILCNFAVAN